MKNIKFFKLCVPFLQSKKGMEFFMKNSSKIILAIVSLIIICIVGGISYLIIRGINERNNEKIEEKIVYATILIQSDAQEESNIKTTQRTKINDTYRALINSKTIKKAVEEKFGTIRDVEFETVEDTQIIKIIYVCDEHTDEECKQILQELIQEFSKRIKEIYDIKDVYIVDKPEITTRMVKK